VLSRPAPWTVLLPLAWLALASAALPAQGEATRDRPDPQNARVLCVPIRGVIDVTTVALVQRALREADSNGIGRIVLVVDTPGGEMEAMHEVEAILSGIAGTRMETTAFVEGNALSAGAYIALACNKLFMATSAKIGAMTPVLLGPTGVQQIPDDVRRKTISALRGEVRTFIERRAKRRPGLELVAEAMVDPDLQVSEVRTADPSGFEETRFVDEAGLRELRERGMTIRQQTALGAAPLTLTAREAERVGISQGTVASLDDLVREEFGVGMDAVWRIESSWSEDTVRWLDAMKPFLFVLGFIFLIIELKTPGFAVPGALGLLLLGLAMFGSYLTGLADWTEILLFFLGIGLILVEVFVMPGTVVFGIAGFLLTVFSLVVSQQTFILPANATQQGILTDNLTNMLLLILLVIGGAIVFWRLLPMLPLFHTLLLPAPAPPPTAARGATSPVDADLVGRTAVAASDLRPAGIAVLDDRRLDVATEGRFVPRGARVRIVAVEGLRIVVEPDEPGPGHPAPGSPQRGEVSIGFLVLLVVIGFALVVAEVFLVSFGIIAVLAALSLVSAVFLAFTNHGQGAGFAFLLAAAVGAPLVLTAALRLLPRTKLGKALILSGPDPSVLGPIDSELHALRDRSGVAESDLRPSGFARIDGRRVDVITRGEVLARGTPVRVVLVEGNRVVVTAQRDGAPPQS
jgi:membrane-bound serine protease (ClpP class)